MLPVPVLRRKTMLMANALKLSGDIDGVDDGPDDESEVPTLAPSDTNFLDNHGFPWEKNTAAMARCKDWVVSQQSHQRNNQQNGNLKPEHKRLGMTTSLPSKNMRLRSRSAVNGKENCPMNQEQRKINFSPANENSSSKQEEQSTNCHPAKDNPPKHNSSSKLQEQNSNFKPTKTKGSPSHAATGNSVLLQDEILNPPMTGKCVKIRIHDDPQTSFQSHSKGTETVNGKENQQQKNMNSSPANENSPSNRQVQRANSRPAKDDPTKDDSSSTLQDQNANFKPTETKGPPSHAATGNSLLIRDKILNPSVTGKFNKIQIYENPHRGLQTHREGTETVCTSVIEVLDLSKKQSEPLHCETSSSGPRYIGDAQHVTPNQEEKRVLQEHPKNSATTVLVESGTLGNPKRTSETLTDFHEQVSNLSQINKPVDLTNSESPVTDQESVTISNSTSMCLQKEVSDLSQKINKPAGLPISGPDTTALVTPTNPSETDEALTDVHREQSFSGDFSVSEQKATPKITDQEINKENGTLTSFQRLRKEMTEETESHFQGSSDFDDTAPICDVERETSLEEVVTPQTTPNVETSKGNEPLTPYLLYTQMRERNVVANQNTLRTALSSPSASGGGKKSCGSNKSNKPKTLSRDKPSGGTKRSVSLGSSQGNEPLTPLLLYSQMREWNMIANQDILRTALSSPEASGEGKKSGGSNKSNKPKTLSQDNPSGVKKLREHTSRLARRKLNYKEDSDSSPDEALVSDTAENWLDTVTSDESEEVLFVPTRRTKSGQQNSQEANLIQSEQRKDESQEASAATTETNISGLQDLTQEHQSEVNLDQAAGLEDLAQEHQPEVNVDQAAGLEDLPEEHQDNILQRQENNAHNGNPPTAPPAKKITKKKEKEDRKLSRNSGKEYVASTGKIVPARACKPVHECSKKKCHVLIPPETAEILFEDYWALGTMNDRVAYVANRIERQEVQRKRLKMEDSNREKNFSFKYFFDIGFKRVQVCRSTFLDVLGETDRFIRDVADNKKKSISGIPTRDARGKHTPSHALPEETSEAINLHIQSIPAYVSHYCRAQTQQLYLPPGTTVSKMHDLYVADGNPPVSYSTYLRFFNESGRKVHAPLGDTCATCDCYDLNIKNTNDEEEKRQLQSDKELHLRKAEKAFELKRQAKAAAKADDTRRVLVFDLEQCLPTPYLRCKKIYYSRQLYVYNLTIYDNVTDRTHCYMWSETEGHKGSNEVTSCVLRHILTEIPAGVTHLTLFSDCCGGQNRNSTMSMMNFIALQEHPTLQTVDHIFLIPGHTFLEVDNKHSIIERYKRKLDHVYVPEDWYKVVHEAGKANKNNPEGIFKVVHITEFYDIVSLAKGPLVARTVCTDKHPFLSLETQWFRYLKNKMGIALVKKSFNEDSPFRERSFLRRGDSCARLLPQTEILANLEVPISHKKKKDLLDLLELIPVVHRQYYMSLPSCSKTPDVHPQLWRVERDEVLESNNTAENPVNTGGLEDSH